MPKTTNKVSKGKLMGSLTASSSSFSSVSSVSSLSETETPTPTSTSTKRRGRPPIKKSAEEKSAPKKRGRKPKGGKIITNNEIDTNDTNSKENIIVHLRCKTSLLQKKTNHVCNVVAFSQKKDDACQINYFNVNKEATKINVMFEQAIVDENAETKTKNSENEVDIDAINKVKSDDERKKRKNELEVVNKLKSLQQNLKHENICLTESDCFWCTCSFENPPIHIPKYIIKDTYHVYGCFCSPECATAFLFDENIDNATRFERYSLLCSLYAKIFKYDKNIKPAPNPYYTLDKYCGNLSIMEYRELFNSNRFLFVINKPITRELPELDIIDENAFN